MNVKNKKLLPVYMAGLVAGKYSLREASESTGYSVNWLCQLKKRYSALGDEAFVHRSKNRPVQNKTPQAVCEKISALYAGKYAGCNFTYFKACLEEFENVNLSLKTVRRILLEYGQRSPEARKVKKDKPVHRPRIRRAHEGDMIQIDATPYPWFFKFDDNKRYCLSGGIDDATGKITGLYITENECLYGYLEMLRQTCTSYGVPREIYSDRAAIFCVTPKSKKDLTTWEALDGIHDKRTQWQRILSDLGINQILAWSPEAKGRVERMWKTIQGQLPQWLYNKNIRTVEAANAELKNYIRFFNSHYSVEPASPDSRYLESPDNLEDILQARFSRMTDSSGCFSFHSYKFAVMDCPSVRNKRIEVCISERGIHALMPDGLYYGIRPCEEVLDGLGETMPQVLQNLVFRYLFAYAKEISA